MASNAITLPALSVNGINIEIVPNSVELTHGYGTSKIKTQSAGGGSIQTVLFEDGSTKLSNLKFKVYPTDVNLNDLIDIKNNSNNNTVLLSDASGFTKTITNAAMISDISALFGVDGEVELEMEGDPAV